MSPANEQSLWSATTRALDAGERLLVERLDLLRTEVRGDVRRTLGGSGLAAAGGLLALAGWGVLMAALVLALAPVVAPAVTLAIIGGVHLLGGIGLLWAAGARLGAAIPRLQAPPDGVPRLPTPSTHGTEARKAAG